MLNTKSMLLGVLSVVVSVEAFAEREWPDKVFDCQVVTSSGAQGLVSLQSYSLKDATEGAVGLPATTLLGSNGAATRVVQCLEKGKGRAFTDSNFQAWVDGLDQ